MLFLCDEELTYIITIMNCKKELSRMKILPSAYSFPEQGLN